MQSLKIKVTCDLCPEGPLLACLPTKSRSGLHVLEEHRNHYSQGQCSYWVTERKP